MRCHAGICAVGCAAASVRVPLGLFQLLPLLDTCVADGQSGGDLPISDMGPEFRPVLSRRSDALLKECAANFFDAAKYGDRVPDRVNGVFQLSARDRVAGGAEHGHVSGTLLLESELFHGGRSGRVTDRHAKDLWREDRLANHDAALRPADPGGRGNERGEGVGELRHGPLFYPNSREFFDGATADKPGFIPDTDLSPIWNPEFFGNMIMVNGNTWPFQTVGQRRYRLRILNRCQSRFLVLDFGQIPGVKVWAIGNEGGFRAER